MISIVERQTQPSSPHSEDAPRALSTPLSINFQASGQSSISHTQSGLSAGSGVELRRATGSELPARVWNTHLEGVFCSNSRQCNTNLACRNHKSTVSQQREFPCNVEEIVHKWKCPVQLRVRKFLHKCPEHVKCSQREASVFGTRLRSHP